ncbi:transcriptional regulator [Erythrobacter sp. QSSC1-22B]|nr:transcriptional regulator [Erythrobacter sp. QSSC1-22B]
MDENDRAILRLLQNDVTLSMEALAARLSMSANTVWRRIKRLQTDGVIARRVALVDPAKVGLDLTVFVTVRTTDHSSEWLEQFGSATQAMPEIMEFYRLAGDTDYLIKLMIRDVADYDRVYKKLIASVPIADVTASFAMETIKNQTALPV